MRGFWLVPGAEPVPCRGWLPSPGPWPICGLPPRTPSTPHPRTHPARHPFQKRLQAADVCQWAQGSQGHPVSGVLNRTRKGLPLCASPPCNHGRLALHLHEGPGERRWPVRAIRAAGNDLLSWDVLGPSHHLPGASVSPSVSPGALIIGAYGPFQKVLRIAIRKPG